MAINTISLATYDNQELIKTKIDTAQTELSTKIDNNKTRITNVETQVSNVSTQLTNSSSAINTNIEDLKTDIADLKSSVSSGKTSIASAITGKGITASGSDTFAQLSTKVGQILKSTGTAVATNVLAGQTFSNGTSAGISGTMANYANTKIQISGYENVTEVIPHPQDPAGQGLITASNAYGRIGYIDTNTQIQFSVANLVPANIVSGVKIGKVGGSGSAVMVGTATAESLGGSRIQIFDGLSDAMTGTMNYTAGSDVDIVRTFSKSFTVGFAPKQVMIIVHGNSRRGGASNEEAAANGKIFLASGPLLTQTYGNVSVSAYVYNGSTTGVNLDSVTFGTTSTLNFTITLYDNGNEDAWGYARLEKVIFIS